MNISENFKSPQSHKTKIFKKNEIVKLKPGDFTFTTIFTVLLDKVFFPNILSLKCPLSATQKCTKAYSVYYSWKFLRFSMIMIH